jgi:hypothetical protein
MIFINPCVRTRTPPPHVDNPLVRKTKIATTTKGNIEEEKEHVLLT